MARGDTDYEPNRRIPRRYGLTTASYGLALAAGSGLLAVALVVGLRTGERPIADLGSLLIGSWQCTTAGPSPQPITFRADGTVSRGPMALRYTVTGNRVSITLPGASNAILHEVKSISSDRLTYTRSDLPEHLSYACDRLLPEQVATATPPALERS